MGKSRVCPNPLSQLLKNIMAVQEVPCLPQSPSGPKQSRQYSMTLRRISGGMSSRGNRQLMPLSSEVGPQSYSVI